MRVIERPLCGATLLLVLGSAAAAAQVCVGTSGFDSAPVRLAVGAATAPYLGQSASQYDVGISAGGPRGAFAGLTGAFDRQPRGSDARALEASVGTSIRPMASRSLSLCPTLRISRQQWQALYGYGPGPSNATNTVRLDEWVNRLAMGASLGGSMRVGSADVLPFFGASYVLRSSLERATYSDSTTSRLDQRHTDAIGILRFGVGIALWRRLTVQPRLDVPVGTGSYAAHARLFDNRTSYGVQLEIGVGP